MSRLGRVLACDWLVTGTLVPTGTRTQVWTKVIDIKTSVVLDLEALPFDPKNLSATMSGISAFLNRAGTTAHGRQFITLGRFTDLSISSTREDWAARLPALIEKHFHAQGVGVVEREAVTPIFEEFQFDQTGLTGSATNRVKIQPAFWVVDGGCKWVRDTEDKVSVALRIQKMGEKEQVFRFTERPGAELERAVIAAVQNALANTNHVSSAEAALGESGFHTERGMEGATLNAPMTPSRYQADPEGRSAGASGAGGMAGFGGAPDPQRQKQWEDNRRGTLESYQKALLLNPNNVAAKYMLGYGLLGDPDPAQRERGKALLQEVTTSTNAPSLANRARFYLSHPELFARGKDGYMAPNTAGVAAPSTTTSVPGGRAPVAQANLPPPGPRFPVAQPALPPSTNGLQRLPVPKPYPQGTFHNITAEVGEGPGLLLIACGTNLFRYDQRYETQEKVEVPVALAHPITTIACDTNSIWLGTEGGGLVQLSKTGGTPRVFTEKDGLLMPSILCSRLRDNRLWLGFGFRESGGLGYLDTASGKFVGLTRDVALFKSQGQTAAGPPDSAVTMISSVDPKTVWVASRSALHCFDVPAQKWTTPLGLGPTCFSVNSNFVAAACPTGGVMICRLPAGPWTKIDLANNYSYNRVDSLRADAVDTRMLWVGTLRTLMLVDMQLSKPIASYDISQTPYRRIRTIMPLRNSVILVANDFHIARSDLCGLFWFEKPAYCKAPSTSEETPPRKLASSN
jgi:hypothetical protein